MHVVVIGGGAAGFFCALNFARLRPDAQVTILERSSKLLSKVRISGGGRSNLTHALFDAKELTKRYPRGARELLSPFHRYAPENVITWFRQRGVSLKTEEDGRMFPVTDSSQTIIDCFMQEADKLHVVIKMNMGVKAITPSGNSYALETTTGDIIADHVVVAAGGNTDEGFRNMLGKLGHSFTPSVPSLFTFNVPGNPVTQLMGVSVTDARIKITGTKLEERGPCLITHWGFSGPAILRLSAWGARVLAEHNYHFHFTINWLGEESQEVFFEILQQFKKKHPQKNILAFDSGLPKRLWKYLAYSCLGSETLSFQEISAKQLQALAGMVCNNLYEARGKTTYKEEFVTCGGINLKEIDFKTMQSKKVPGLYFAGEIIDVDGITGGFNFQNAWTTAWIAANAMAEG
jgi:predicted Rossmann fold flavoprotein